MARVDCSVNAPACQNGGTCQGGTTCACGQYSGDQCQNARWCDSNPCQNGGTCTNQNTIPTGGPTSRGFCSCTTDFAGTFCERPSFCSTNPCQNGGTCNTGSSTCTCTQGWEGANCTVPLFCSSNPCQNGANCTNTISAAGGAGTCGPCPEGYAGVFCEKSRCTSRPLSPAACEPLLTCALWLISIALRLWWWCDATRRDSGLWYPARGLQSGAHDRVWYRQSVL
jgi:hypothetical protein